MKMELFHTTVSEESKKLVAQVLDSGFLNQGKMNDLFEKTLREQGYHNALTTNSCTAALHIALECCEVRGREVILPAQTFVATGLAVLMAGGIPVFVDCDVNGNMDYSSAAKNVTDKTAAIICVHWGGIPCDLASIHSVAARGHIPVIEDCAHAMGALHGPNRHVGTESHFGCYSFQSIKLMTTGDGGMITCNNAEHMEKIRRLRWFGIDKLGLERYIEGDRVCSIEELGYKYHMNDIAAAIGLGNLTELGMTLKRRKEIAERYLYNLTPLKSDLQTPSVLDWRLPSWWLFTLKVRDRQDFIRHMREHDIPVSVVDRRIDQHPVFKKHGGRSSTFMPGQEFFDKYQISIPIHEGLTDDDVDHVINTIRKGW